MGGRVLSSNLSTPTKKSPVDSQQLTVSWLLFYFLARLAHPAMGGRVLSSLPERSNSIL